ncbi:MAG TPA: hypothetical protein VH723_10155 [Candidatus Limnocylindrales bacterium]
MTSWLGSRAGSAFLVLFAVSTAFPILASFFQAEALPSPLGPLDVAIAVATILLGLAIEAGFRDSATDEDGLLAWRVVRILASVPLVLLAVYLLRPDTFRWDVLLVGLAWRVWLLVWILPSLAAALRARRA